jgi:tRNA(ile)-lysidine synthetase
LAQILQNREISLDEVALNELKKQKKSILAFSHGVDSTALFYLLVAQNIEFDLALVNYNTRKNSTIEAQSAIELAQKFGKKIYIKSVKFGEKKSDFERDAREIRYKFFAQICTKFGYENVIFAHQLNDLFEWFLMRFSRGAGLCNLIGMSAVQRCESVIKFKDEKCGDIASCDATSFAKFDTNIIKQNSNLVTFTAIRPLLNVSKNALREFLNARNLRYFEDESNTDTRFERNFFRLNFSDEFVGRFSAGVARSFDILQREKEQILGEFAFENGEFFVIKKLVGWENLCDKAVKKLGVILSTKEREKLSADCVLCGKICLSHYQNANAHEFIFIHLRKDAVMPKKIKELFRKLRVPKFARTYLFAHKEILEKLQILGILK